MISLYQLVLFLKQLPIMQKNSWIPRSQGEGVTKDLLGFPESSVGIFSNIIELKRIDVGRWNFNVFLKKLDTHTHGV